MWRPASGSLCSCAALRCVACGRTGMFADQRQLATLRICSAIRGNTLTYMMVPTIVSPVLCLSSCECTDMKVKGSRRFGALPVWETAIIRHCFRRVESFPSIDWFHHVLLY